MIGRVMVGAAVAVVSAMTPVHADIGCPMSLSPADMAIVKARQQSGIYDQKRGLDSTPHVISIAWHVLQRSDGTTAVDAETLESMIDYINEVWASENISFAAHPLINYIVDDSLWNNLNSDYAVDQFRSTTPLENALNVYWAPSLLNGSLCGISAFSFMSIDSIAMPPQCVGRPDVRGVFAHEVGHWFDLFHTFETYDGTECVSGSNCATAGDLVCDTPASFGLEFDVCVDAANCELTCTNVAGPCPGDPVYDPSTVNFMSYSTPNCLTEFTPGQYSRLRTTAVNFRVDYLDTYLHDPCPADFDGNSVVDVDDLLSFLAAFGCQDCEADFNRDGTANIDDLLQLLAAWGGCYECGEAGDCDDGNPGTVDYCIFGECINAACGPGLIEDCNGNCAPETWLNDGYCDDGAYEYDGVFIDFNCAEFNCDQGDCACP